MNFVNKKSMRKKQYICGCMIGALLSVGAVGFSLPAVVIASSKDTVVCDDNSCSTVTFTVPDKVSLYVGNNKKLNVTMSKKKEVKVSYKTSDQSVATVSSGGKITGKKKGTVTVTTTIGGTHVQKKLTFTTKVTVKSPSIQIVASKKKVNVGKTITLKVKKKGTKKQVLWSVNKKTIAVIGKKNGKLKGKKAGKVKVTATCGSLKKSITITVK